MSSMLRSSRNEYNNSKIQFGGKIIDFDVY